jgi:hypothetical protein
MLLTRLGIFEIDLLLRDLGSYGCDVLVIENVKHVPSYQARLAYTDIADEAYLEFLHITAFDQWPNNSFGL